MAKIRTRCPGCSSPIRASKDAFCGQCGRRNPLLAPRVVRRRTAAKTAGYAPVIPLQAGAIRESPLGRAYYRENDPARRELVADAIFKSAVPLYDSACQSAVRTGSAWAAIKAEPDPDRRQALYSMYFGGGAA